MKITVKAPAKINLTLDIVGKRPDGYHDVAMVMQTVSLYDTVTVEDFDGEGIEVSCPAYPDVPVDDSNIGLKGSPTQIAKASDKVRKGAGTQYIPEDATDAAEYITAKLKEKFII